MARVQITPEKKEEYREMRREYYTQKSDLADKMSGHLKDIKGLGAKLENARPKTENGKYLCEPCDMISLVYLGRTPQGGLAGGDDILRCEVCDGDGSKESYPSWRFGL